MKLTLMHFSQWTQNLFYISYFFVYIFNRSLNWEDPTCHGASKPVHHTTEPLLQSLGTPTTEAHVGLEPVIHKRTHHNERPVHCNWRVATPHCNQGKSLHSNEDLALPKVTKINKNVKSTNKNIFYHSPQRNPLSSYSLFLPPPAPGNHKSAFIFMDLPTLDLLYKGNHTMYGPW